MIIPPSHQEGLKHREKFLQCLAPHDQRVLEMISQEGMTYKEIAHRIRCSVKTVERATNRITVEYEKYQQLPHRTTSFKKILTYIAPYFYLRDLLN